MSRHSFCFVVIALIAAAAFQMLWPAPSFSRQAAATSLTAAQTLATPAVPQRAESCSQPSPNPIVRIKVGDRPFMAVATHDGCWIFVTTGFDPVNKLKTGLAVLRRDGGSVSEIRFVSMKAANAMALTHDGKTLLVGAGTEVQLFDVARLTSGQPDPMIRAISDNRFGPAIIQVSSDDRYALIAQANTEWLSIIDLARARGADFSKAIVGGMPFGQALGPVFSPDGHYLYFAMREAPPTREFAEWPAVCRNLQTEGPPLLEGFVLVIDVDRARTDPSASIVSRIRAGCATVGVAVSPDGNTIYASAKGDNSVSAFDVRPIRNGGAAVLLGKAKVGNFPTDVAVVDNGKKLIVANTNTQNVKVVNPSDKTTLTVLDTAKIVTGGDAAIGTIPAGANPWHLAVTDDGRTLLVVNHGSDALDVVDLQRLAQIGETPKP